MAETSGGKGGVPSKRTPRERVIQDKIVKWLNAQPDTMAKVITAGGLSEEAGHPDILAVIGGRALFIEVKRPGQSPRKIQQVQLKRWKRAGAAAIVAESLEKVQACHKEITEDNQWANALLGLKQNEIE